MFRSGIDLIVVEFEWGFMAIQNSDPLLSEKQNLLAHQTKKLGARHVCGPIRTNQLKSSISQLTLIKWVETSNIDGHNRISPLSTTYGIK